MRDIVPTPSPEGERISRMTSEVIDQPRAPVIIIIDGVDEDHKATDVLAG